MAGGRKSKSNLKIDMANDSDNTATAQSPLTPSRVQEILVECLFKEGEPTENHVVGEGVMFSAGLHPERLAAHKEEILSLLHQLPDDFREDKGGGWSFLQACMTRDGRQWGEHRNIDELLVLGTATGQAKILSLRETWGLLPGGMPYFSVVGLPPEAPADQSGTEEVSALSQSPVAEVALPGGVPEGRSDLLAG